MIRSFRTIESEMRHPDIPLDLKWAMLHAIHTTADFDMEEVVKADPDALQRIYDTLSSGRERVIVTDVTMAASGIRKGALERLGLEVKCYLHHPEVAEMASRLGITRTQAGIRIAAREHPGALYVFGNAPTALTELCTLMRHGDADPCGIVGCACGFRACLREQAHGQDIHQSAQDHSRGAQGWQQSGSDAGQRHSVPPRCREPETRTRCVVSRS